MRVLITGATGLVGSHIVKECQEKGIAVNYLTTSKDKIVSEHNYKGFYWNPDSQEIDVSCFEEVDAIINLAGATISKRWTSSYKKEIIDSRVDSAALLFNTLKTSNFNITRFVSASAIGIYPSSLEKLYFEEDTPSDDSFLQEVVIKWEKAANQFEALGIEVAKIRIGLVLAEEGGALEKMKEPVSYSVGAGLGSGKQWQSWIHINDLAKMFLYLIENDLSGVYNGVAPSPVTNNELIKEIAKQLNKPLWMPNVPKLVLKAGLGEMSTIVLSSQLVSSNKIENAGFEFQYRNLTKSLQDLL
ncbi:TIGR01777 family oxidoreductase [Gillisia sp. M10.2A]|uniref:TIGR01777 family oxidoreductase n=1 Tax=Gillisia lutea TaxID=2909668 RepID=A0ABS9EGT2_9FLAO|nr:TIGR01777 family oxidoreductase [Gillisia lutea]MCF4102077.1 TIGR01777 family oxidoreductase [Gillisia lutea]